MSKTSLDLETGRFIKSIYLTEIGYLEMNVK